MFASVVQTNSRTNEQVNHIFNCSCHRFLSINEGATNGTNNQRTEKQRQKSEQANNLTNHFYVRERCCLIQIKWNEPKPKYFVKEKNDKTEMSTKQTKLRFFCCKWKSNSKCDVSYLVSGILCKDTFHCLLACNRISILYHSPEICWINSKIYQ